MIILTEIQKEKVNSLKVNYAEYFKSKSIDIFPVEIKGNLFILPESILEDIRFSKFIKELEIEKFEIREIKEEELIVFDITKL